jgi:hypothetical protein
VHAARNSIDESDASQVRPLLIIHSIV